ncbi:hypothetical protein JTB14_014660 [Gonioctena quinquepunctata]|nr:hypothetical protein JTB14_014660 [Gonioctena quinquepunctata]
MKDGKFRQEGQMEPIDDKICLGHVWSMPNKRLPKKVYRIRAQGGKNQGRPQRTWKDRTNEETKRTGIPWNGIKGFYRTEKIKKELYEARKSALHLTVKRVSG